MGAVVGRRNNEKVIIMSMPVLYIRHKAYLFSAKLVVLNRLYSFVILYIVVSPSTEVDLLSFTTIFLQRLPRPGSISQR